MLITLFVMKEVFVSKKQEFKLEYIPLNTGLFKVRLIEENTFIVCRFQSK